MMKRTVLLLALLTFCFAFSAYADSIDEQLAGNRQKLSKIEKETEFHQKEIVQNKAKKKGYLAELDDLDKKIKATELKEQKLNGQIGTLTGRTEALTRDIESRKNKVEDLRKQLQGRLVAMYKYGDAAEYNLVLSSQDRVELATVSYLLNRMARQDQQMMRSLYTEALRLADDRKELQQQKAALAKAKADVVANRRENAAAVAARKDLIAQIDQNLEAHQKAMQELEADQRALQQTIDRLLAEKARASQSASSKAPVVVNRGGLIWPLASHKISDPFGMRVHPKFKTKSMHTGIDLPSPKGTPVKAAGSGTVIFAGWMRGYGQIIIIDHGNNMATVYAHLSAIGVKENQAVRQGDVVGRVGNTGVATGYHLHFEVRIGGQAKNPVNYLPK